MAGGLGVADIYAHASGIGSEASLHDVDSKLPGKLTVLLCEMSHAWVDGDARMVRHQEKAATVQDELMRSRKELIYWAARGAGEHNKEIGVFDVRFRG